MANKGNFLKYEYNNEVSSHKKFTVHFAFIQEYTQLQYIYVISLLTAKCGVGAAVLASVTVKVAASLLEQAINIFYKLTIHCTGAMEKQNG